MIPPTGDGQPAKKRRERHARNQLVIHSPDGTFHAYVARPAKVPAPAVVVLQELFGVNADIRATCDELAAQGFIAIAPDLFWRQEPDVDLDVTSEAAWQHGLRLYTAFDRDAGVRDVKETVRVAAELAGSTGKVALLGYCLGALMVFLTAARSDVDAAVAYHGGDTEKYLGEVGGLKAPLLMHLGEEDEFISRPRKVRSRRPWRQRRAQPCTAIRGSVMRFRGTTVPITMRQPLPSPTSARANF